MNIAMDIRVLATMPRTGVGEYTFELLNAIFLLSPQNTYFLLSSGCKKFFMPPEWQKPNIILIHLSFSNRLLNILMFLFKWPRLTDWPRLARWPHLNKKCVPNFFRGNSVFGIGLCDRNIYYKQLIRLSCLHIIRGAM